MIKKLSIPVLAMLLAVCGFSAWSARQAVAKAADTSFGLAAEGSTLVEGGSYAGIEKAYGENGILIAFDCGYMQLNNFGNVIPKPSFAAEVLDNAGNQVLKWGMGSVDLQGNGVLHLWKLEDIYATAPAHGNYILHIPAGVVLNGDDNTIGNEEIRINFTITEGTGGGDDPGPTPGGGLKLNNTTPADGDEVESIKEIIFSFDAESIDLDRTLPSYGTITKKNASAPAHTLIVNNFSWTKLDGNWCGDNEYAYAVNPAITEPGEYTVSIPAGVFTSGNATSEAIEFTVTIPGGGDTPQPGNGFGVLSSSVPSDGAALTAIDNFHVDFDTNGAEINIVYGQTCGYLKKDGETVYTWNSANCQYDFGKVYSLKYKTPEANVLATLTSGQYTFEVPAGCVSINGGAETNDAYSVTFNYTAPEGDIKFDLSLQNPKNGSTVEKEKFGNITIKLPQYGLTVGDKVTLKKADGATVEANVNKTFYDGEMDMSIIIMADAALPADGFGEWSLSLPEGFVSGAGMTSNAAEWKWTWKNPNQGGTEYPEFEVTKFGYQGKGAYTDGDRGDGQTGFKLKSTDTEIDLLPENPAELPKIASLNQMSALILETTLDEWIEGFTVLITYDGFDDNGNPANIVHTSTIQYTDVAFLNDFSNPYKHPVSFWGGNENSRLFYEGVEYTITYLLFDSKAKISKGREHAVGIVERKFMGTTPAFAFSPAKFLNYDEVSNSVVTDLNAPITFTFSQPVTMKCAANAGMGTTEPVSSVTSNADRTVWYVVPGENVVKGYDMQTGAPVTVNEFQLIMSAKDDNGMVLEGPSGIKDSSCWMITFNYPGKGAEVTITPAAGEVKSLKEFTVAADKVIAQGEEADAPYVTTASGVKVATATSFTAGENNTLKFTLDTEITEPGSYILVAPFAAFLLGDDKSEKSLDQTIAYTIAGKATKAVPTIAEGSEVHSLSLAGFRIDNYVNLDSKVRIHLYADDERISSMPVEASASNGRTLLVGDFSENGKAMQLEAGKAYRLMIPGSLVTVNGTAVKYENMEVNFKALETAAPEYVSLTKKINGQAATTAKVAKGEAATVTFTPADNWKLASVKFNGTDVTSSVADNAYTTEALAADATVEAEFEYSGVTVNATNDVNEILGDFKLRAWSENGAIIVSGLAQGMNVRLFSANGMLIAEHASSEFDTVKFGNVATGETYIIVVSNGSKTEAIKLLHK